MKFFSDLFALILFFVIYSTTKNIFWATASAMVIGILQAAAAWIKHKRLDTMQWVSLLLIVVLGGATLAFHNDAFIKWKPTVLFWLSALALAIGHMMGKNGLKSMLGKEFALPDAIWVKLTAAWVIFLLLLGAINLIVAFSFSQSVWVNYKLFGSMPLLFLFVLAQGIYLSRHLPQETNHE